MFACLREPASNFLKISLNRLNLWQILKKTAILICNEHFTIANKSLIKYPGIGATDGKK